MAESATRFNWLEISVGFTFLAVCFGLPFTGERGAPLTILYVSCFTLIIVSWLAAGSARRLTPSKPAFFLLAVNLFSLVSTLFSPWANWYFGAVALVSSAGYLTFASLGANSRRRLKSLVLLIAIVQSVLALLQFATNSLLYRPNRIGLSNNAFFSGAERAEGTIGQPLALGALLLTGFLFLMASQTVRAWHKVFGGLLLLSGMVTTGSASIVVTALLTWLLGTMFFSSQKARPTLIIVLCSLALLAAASGTLSFGILNEFSLSANSQRVDSWNAFPRLLQEQPPFPLLFGNGWGSENYLFSNGYITDSVSHAIDFQFLSTLGIAGVLGLISLVFFGASSLAHSLSSRSREFQALFANIALFLSFDVLAWAVTSLLIGLLASEGVEIGQPSPAEETGLK